MGVVFSQSLLFQCKQVFDVVAVVVEVVRDIALVELTNRFADL